MGYDADCNDIYGTEIPTLGCPYGKKRYCATIHCMPRQMVVRSNSKQNSGKLKDAASLLLRGATLLNEPCPSCAGVQVRFQNKNICINRCDLQDVAAEAPQKESIPTFDDMMMNTNRDLVKSIIQEKIMLLVQQLRDENDISKVMLEG
jgi:UPF0148 protein